MTEETARVLAALENVDENARNLSVRARKEKIWQHHDKPPVFCIFPVYGLPSRSKNRMIGFV